MSVKTKTPRRGPVIIEADLPDVEAPEQAPPVPEILMPEGRAMQRVTALAARKSGWLARLFWGGVSGLIGMMISVALWDFIVGLLARNLLLGQIALGFMALIAVILFILLLRELAAFSRLARVDSIRQQVQDATKNAGKPAAEKVIKRLNGLYGGRAEMRWARDVLADQQGEVIDGPDLLAIAERQFMEPLDSAAAGEIQIAARSVAAATALIPMAAIDVLVALGANIRMVRRIAEVYGGRAGMLGSWRLLRAVATHLLATGVVAVGDDMLGSVLGGGALSKISRKFGEGVINGALTTRVGLAAMEVCRPMPFSALKRPSVSGVLKKALVGLFS
ncbi:MAG: TIGR01620 family protein [Paracoccaceae bacterium]